jgi:predicted alpha/beta-hydrolase family hydrolase
MERWAGLLAPLGRVERFDYPYMAAGKKRPDRHPVLLEAHRAALERHRRPGEPVVLIGKSMGSRIGCHLAIEEPVEAVVCLGYPLAGMGNRAKLRDAVLLEQRQPVLFVQGTRDKLCPLDLLEEARARMTVATALHIVEAGDHSLHVTKTWMKTHGLTQEDADAAAVDAIREFLRAR